MQLPLQNIVALAVVWSTLGVSPPWPLPYGVVISALWVSGAALQLYSSKDPSLAPPF